MPGGFNWLQFIAIAINGPRWFSNVEPAKVNFLYMTGQQDPYVAFSLVLVGFLLMGVAYLAVRVNRRHISQ